ncbi:amidohydrolase 2 [Xylariaceae sp. FL0662B]|nr:amidohydrolase 2 [Xylariaceae sp. FL0662B]
MPPSFSITLEEHVVFPSLGSDRPFYNDIWKVFPEVKGALEDHSTGRIGDLDKGHVSFQVMSHLPGMSNHNVEGCRRANDEMTEAIKKNPNRLGGFAALPMASPGTAATELERAVKELGLLGAMIDSHLGDMSHYDDERFWPVFEAAERLDVPLYIHPGPPEDTRVKERFSGNYSGVIMQGLSTGAWGWHEDVGLHVVKLYSAGVFAHFPGLKIIIGHMGEMIPMMIDRIDSLKFYKSGLGSFTDTWNRNIWVTSSGMFSVRALEMLLKVTRMDRVMYSIDTPFNKSILGWNYLQELGEKGLLSKEEQNLFAYGNAKRLLKLDLELHKL